MLSVCWPCEGGAAARKAACFVCVDFYVYIEHIVTIHWVCIISCVIRFYVCNCLVKCEAAFVVIMFCFSQCKSGLVVN